MNSFENLTGKKLLILGGNHETGVLVKKANDLGVYTIAVDPNPKAPAKIHSKKHYDIDGFDIPNLIKVAMKEKVDGVLVGVADILVPPYLRLCEKLGLPCYASDKIIAALSSKDGFIDACKQYDIETVPTFRLDESLKPEDLNEIKYPVVVKPVDNGGGVGISICYNEQELISGAKNAIKNSRKRSFITERLMHTDDINAYYTFKDGEIFLSSIADRITTKKQDRSSPICIANVYPSKHTNRYYECMHPKMSKMFKGIGIKQHGSKEDRYVHLDMDNYQTPTIWSYK